MLSPPRAANRWQRVESAQPPVPQGSEHPTFAVIVWQSGPVHVRLPVSATMIRHASTRGTRDSLDNTSFFFVCFVRFIARSFAVAWCKALAAPPCTVDARFVSLSASAPSRRADTALGRLPQQFRLQGFAGRLGPCRS